MLPQTKGAKHLYDTFLRDILKQNESKIDAALADAKKSAGQVASEASAATSEAVSAAMSTSGTESKKDD